ncbi:hypothetical protein [Desulfatirhabdium butyrativorans]|uniref:hypothetical protein n=1 Tax=Desulfatirhabdium butyrativorans TaxID=340467 RepID=UPI0006881B91|nr:hypothetical protein [Desulfatirhabdium butyrativorans]
MMSKTRRFIFLTIATAFFSATVAFGANGSRELWSTYQFISKAEQNEFIVLTGSATHFDPIGQYCAGKLPNALYSNNGAPYAAAMVPDSPRGEAPTLLGPEFRIAPDEAVVLMGLTPPEEKYYSYQIYLSHRQYPAEAGPKFLLNSLGDTVNINTIHKMGSDPFNTPVVLIFTADKDIDAQIREALIGSGIPSSIINTLVIPSTILKLGLDENSDTFLIANRNALFADQNAGDAYVANPTLAVFRVTPKNPATLNPFPTPTLRIRGSGQTEMDLMPSIEKLRQAIIDANSGFTPTEYTTSPMAYEGYDYTQRGLPTLGDTRDALYMGAGYMPEFNSLDKLQLGDDDFLIAYGVNHVATGKATYANINSYASEKAKLALGSAFSGDFGGSSYPYLGSGDPAADLTYVYKISRHCQPNESFCLQMEAPSQCSGFQLDSDTLLGIAFRLYMEPATSIGAAYSEILYDRIIKFSKKQ